MYFEPKEFGKRLQELRKEKGLTQLEVAEELNVSLSQLKKMESGERTCSIELLMEISDYFEVTERYLLRGVDRKVKDEKERLLAIIEELNVIVKSN